MSFINFSKKEISFKIVYYGPALCGKTTNVEQIHRTIASQDKGELTMLSTQQDRTLFFDFLPLKSDIIKGFSSKFQIYTVPGQVIYNETRRLVLRNVDGIVFVADSQWSKMEENAESYANLEDNLQKQGMTLEKLPYILQFNKRDLPEVAPAHYMDFMMNQRTMRAPTLEAVARESQGVMESLNLIAKMVLGQFIESNKMQSREMPTEVVTRKDG
ncbi:MAG TPA: gliding-motility protein MglA [Verrucomicrobia bacterium]|nr:MAG: gliding-motility protein MglA [Lentisphaerae bacterium GWF2_57_35]HBA83865.1 gliding-motility protein MglA [Verrucomicrobiota bacterium]